jgi:hypothetical protein
VAKEAFVVGHDLRVRNVISRRESRPHARERQRIALDSPERRDEVAPSRLRGLRRTNAFVLQDTPQHERAVGRAVASIADDLYRIVIDRTSDRAGGASRLPRELAEDSEEIISP